MPRLLVLALAAAVAACAPDTRQADAGSAADDAIEARIAEVEAAGGTVRRAAFVVTEGVFNSELMAPYDVLHHTRFRDSLDYVEPFVVSPDGGPVTTFEGLTVEAHYSYATAPTADILVIPSTDGSLDRDLSDSAYLGYISQATAAADWVLTVCDGAFPLAATGALDGRVATTFPADRAALAARFPEVDVRDDVRLVVDGKYVTSVGGGMSYEPAFWLVEHLWGADRVAGNAEGLVWPWDLSTLPHLVVE
ncbi:DJ-1/PfpI family protein [Rubrivirga sp. IMCC45206]|uniref:DJ-1/PfpI family protein n=1 Tax=Rubrivirga sp. IMCC45206 TaxID=3391614 RepID=UPI00398FC206